MDPLPEFQGAAGVLGQTHDCSGLRDAPKGGYVGAPACPMERGPSVMRESCEGGRTTQEVDRGRGTDADRTEGKLGTHGPSKVSAHLGEREASEGTRDLLWSWG